jgi:hypothetical protein
MGEEEKVVRVYDNQEAAEDFMMSCIEEDVMFRKVNEVNSDVRDYDKSKSIFSKRRIVSGKFVGSVESDPVFYFIRKVPVRGVP